MSNAQTSHSEVSALKSLIKGFIQKRLQDKLDKLAEEDSKRQEVINGHIPENWIADAARRVTQIQLVSHAVKYQNPDAKGTNIYAASEPQTENRFVSTKTLNSKNRRDDVTGNAASLDVYKFLHLSHNDETLLKRIIRQDSNLRAALPGTEQQKDEWLSAFAGITEGSNEPATHELAKQLYFPVAENDYHIIAPLFPTSLTHVVFQHVQTRFSEETKTAREARRKKKPHTQGYHEHTNLAIQKFGGSKPQNISQLNSERGGKIYLLVSLPPLWQDQGLKPPLNVNSIFPHKFATRVRPVVIQLRKHLKKFKDWNNMDIRQTRADFVNQICDELLNFAAKIQQLPVGWSTNTKCKLPIAQTFWLDPGRANIDKDWGKQRELSDWQNEITDSFATWLNNVLQMKELPHFGDNEHWEWKRILNRELNLLRDAL